MVNRDKYYKPKGSTKYSLGKYKDKIPTALNLYSEATKKDIAKDFNSEKEVDNSDVTPDDSQDE